MGVGVRIKLELCLKISPPLHAKRTATLNAVWRAVFTNSAAISPTTVLITREFHLVGPLTRVYTVGISPTAVLIARERCLVGPLTRVYIRQFEGIPTHYIYSCNKSAHRCTNHAQIPFGGGR